MLRQLLPFLAAAALALGALHCGQAQAQTVFERFQQFDKNADGKLIRKEFPAPKIFDGADVNKDGLLTREELAAYFRKQPSGTPDDLTTPPTPKPQPTPAAAEKVEVVETLDVPYASIEGVDPNLLSLDIHAPKGAKGLPVVIYVHGGFWKAGDKSQQGRLPEFFCRHGFVFISANYRLAPAAKHPLLIEDVARAVAWVHDHVAGHGGDPAQLFLAGHSAGAQLVALLGTDAKRLGQRGKPLSILRAVIPLDSAAMDIRSVAAGDPRPDSPYRAAFGDDPAAWADASPLVHAEGAKSLPPFQVVVAYGPAIANKKAGVDAFAAALRNGGTRAEVVDASSLREHQSLMTEFGAEGDPVGAAVLEFIASVLGGETDAGLGSERVLKPEGPAAEAAAQQLEAYRTRVLMMQFDKNRDGHITKDEMPSQPFLFDRLDTNRDGVVNAAELGAYDPQREAPPQPAPALPRKSTAPWLPQDEAVGSADVSYRDPELLQAGGLMVFADNTGDVWVGEVDLQTGRFNGSRDGRQHRVDGPISPWSRYCNGPEWGLDADGPALFYIKDNPQGTGQLWRAMPPWDMPRVAQLTHDTDIHNWICEPSVNATLPGTRVIIYRGLGPKGGNVTAWLDEDAPAAPRAFTERAYLARFSIDTPHITWSPRQRAGDRSTTQVSLLDTDTGKVRVMTADDGAKYDPWLWRAPEFDGELLLCVNLDERALAIYRDTGRDGKSPWARIAEIHLPAGVAHPQLKSCEPVNGGRGAFGRSWFTAQGGDDKDRDTSIWLIGFDRDGDHIVRRLDDGAVTQTTARRLDPESLVGEHELFVYYTRVASGGSELRLCRTGVKSLQPKDWTPTPP